MIFAPQRGYVNVADVHRIHIIRGSLNTFQKGDKVPFVVRSFWILPIEIETVESVFTQERNGAEDECLARITGG